MARNAKSLAEDCSGVVFAEFLIAIVPLWVFFLCVVQLALVARASLMVKHAADSAARSAAVVLPDDPSEYGDEPEMSLDRSPLATADLMAAIDQLSDALGGSSHGSLPSALSSNAFANAGRSRLNTIRLVAYVALAPLAPPNIGIGSRPSLRKAIRDARGMSGALLYQPFALAVTFPGLDGSVASGPEITVRVTYAYQCVVPLARRLLCRAFDELPSRGDYERAAAPALWRITGSHFRELQHQTTLMIHDASYRYRARGS
jgi:hypothetical protein